MKYIILSILLAIRNLNNKVIYFKIIDYVID